MERVSRRLVVLIAIAVVGGAIAVFAPHADPPVRNQQYFVDRVPKDMDEFHYVAARDPGEETWKALGPDAIIEYVYGMPKGRYVDFLLLAGRTSSAFHDPQICFRNQGWRVDRTFVRAMKVDSLGRSIPVNVVAMTDEGGRKSTGMYFFVGPLGYDANPLKVEIALFSAKTLGVSTGQGYFFRFVVQGSTGDVEADLAAIQPFVSRMLGELKKSLPQAVGA